MELFSLFLNRSLHLKTMFKKFLNFSKSKLDIIVVSGLPRSGTSMMVSLIAAGGIPSLTDGKRAADQDNPRGYFELERVKKLSEGDVGWLVDAQGKVVKIIAGLLTGLPTGFSYKVLFMNRKMPEILASQRAMLLRRGEDPEKVDDKAMESLYRKHLASVKKWISEQKNIEAIDIDYNQMIDDPWPEIDRINQFLGGRLDRDRMTATIDPQLYRQRKARDNR